MDLGRSESNSDGESPNAIDEIGDIQNENPQLNLQRTCL